MNDILNKIKKCDSLANLREIGSIKDISTAVNKEIYPLVVNATTYECLYEIIVALDAHWDTFIKDEYFKSEKLRYIFALTHMEGTKRNEVINLTNRLYENKNEAKKWYLEIANKIHPDKNMNYQKKANEAMSELQKIYNRIKKCFEDGDE